MVIKIVNIKDTTKVSLVSDNNKPVRSATWDPTGKYLVSGSFVLGADEQTSRLAERSSPVDDGIVRRQTESV